MKHATRVMIVDDEVAVRTALELAMPRHFEVRTAGSAEEALPALLEAEADLILVDKNLPGMSGLDLLRRLRAELASPPWALLITGFASVQSAMESLDLRVYGYLEKPFRDIYEVVRQVERLAALKVACERADPARPARPPQAPPVSRALVLAPDAANADLLCAGLSANGVRPVPVRSAEEAIRQGRKEAVPLLVLDGELESALLETIHKIRQVCPRARFVVAHERPSLRLLTQLIQLGVVLGVVEKPFDREAVPARLGHLLAPLGTAPVQDPEVA